MDENQIACGCKPRRRNRVGWLHEAPVVGVSQHWQSPPSEPVPTSLLGCLYFRGLFASASRQRVSVPVGDRHGSALLYRVARVIAAGDAPVRPAKPPQRSEAGPARGGDTALSQRAWRGISPARAKAPIRLHTSLSFGHRTPREAHPSVPGVSVPAQPFSPPSLRGSRDMKGKQQDRSRKARERGYEDYHRGVHENPYRWHSRKQGMALAAWWDAGYEKARAEREQ